MDLRSSLLWYPHQMEANPQYVVLFHHFRRLLKEAEKNKINVAPLKGAHLLTSVYEEGEDRGSMADVDFLVRPTDWDRIQEMLADLGFERANLVNRPATNREFYEVSYYLPISNGKRILFEPHRYLVQPARHNIDYDALWDRSVDSDFDGVPCRRLSAEDYALHTVIHMMTDSFIRPNKGLGDLKKLLRVGGADLNVILKRSVKWECRRSTWLALVLLSENEPKLEIDIRDVKLQVPTHVKVALRTLVPDARGFIFPHLRLRARQAILFPLLMDGTGPLIRFASDYAWLRTRDLVEVVSQNVD